MDKQTADNENGKIGLVNADKLTALELNGIKLNKKHTVLTPDRLESMAEDKG